MHSYYTIILKSESETNTKNGSNAKKNSVAENAFKHFCFIVEIASNERTNERRFSSRPPLNLNFGPSSKMQKRENKEKG